MNNYVNSINLFLRNVLSIGLILLVLGFYLSPTPGNHERIYLYFIIIPFILLLLTSYSDLAPYTNDRLFIVTEIVLLYLTMTVLWRDGFQLIELFPQLRKLLSITVLLLTVRIALHHYPRLQGIVLLLMSLAACIVACLALIKFLPTHFETQARFTPKVGSILALGRYSNPIRVGWTWGATALCTLWIFYSQKGKNYLWLFLVLPPQLALLVATFSRGPLLAFFICLPIVLFFKRHAVLEKRNLVAVLCFFAIGISASMATGLGHKVYSGLTRGRNNFSHEASQGYSLRIPIWRNVIKQTSHHIVFGQGFSKENKIILSDKLSFTHSHNFIIDVYRFGGLIGVMLVTMHLLYCLTIAFRHSPQDHKIWGVLLCYGILCLLTNGKYVLNNLSEFWLIYWLPISFIYALRNMALSTNLPERSHGISLDQASTA